MTRLIPQRELHGQQVLDIHQAMDTFRQALNRPDELPGFDALLDAMGLNQSNYLQGANQRKLVEAISNGACAAIGVGTAGAGGVVCMLVVSGVLAAQMADGGTQAGDVIGEQLYEMSK